MDTETLNDTKWDVLLSGTGIQQSLLALALSRSNKKVLHVDKDDFYGGSEAAFSLQEAESWVKSIKSGTSSRTLFQDASIIVPTPPEEASTKLSFSRAYSLALAPQLIYTDSTLLPSLVSSKTYRQLEFVAMGSWFIYENESGALLASSANGGLLKIPTTREDLVFSDKSIDIRSKRAVMKVIRFLMEYESQQAIWRPYSRRPFSDLLSEHFKLADRFHSLFLALTLSFDTPTNTTTSFALPRVARHLRSTGRLGPGFSSVIPKWGGLSEVAQVACRAGAVGGAVYVLGKGVTESSSKSAQEKAGQHRFAVELDREEHVEVSWIVGGEKDLALDTKVQSLPKLDGSTSIRRSISIVSSSLPALFPEAVEGSPPPAGAIVVFPAGSLSAEEGSASASLPVYLIVHSSDTGECPNGQSNIYASTSGPTSLLDEAVKRLLAVMADTSQPVILWCLKYEQQGPGADHSGSDPKTNAEDGTVIFPSPSLDLAFDEAVLDAVKEAWQRIIGPEAKDFLVFEERNPVGDEDEE